MIHVSSSVSKGCQGRRWERMGRSRSFDDGCCGRTSFVRRVRAIRMTEEHLKGRNPCLVPSRTSFLRSMTSSSLSMSQVALS